MWNPWHGCHKLSEGCRHCYVYRGDSQRGRDSSIITKTGKFDFPIQRKRNNTYKIPPGNLVYTCFTSDFLYKNMPVNKKITVNAMTRFCKTLLIPLPPINSL